MNWSEENQKTRNLPISEYFEALQKEYLVMEIRSKIYRDKQYYYDIMDHKASRIKDIARRNALPCIFDDYAVKSELESIVFGKRGLPNFLYRDERARNKFSTRDIRCYYAVGTEVKVHMSESDKDFQIGTIQAFNLDTMIVTVRLKGGKEVVSSHNNVTRIL